MQRHQRIRHRLLWILLGPLALGALAYALMNRVEMPVMEEFPAEVERQEGGAR